MQYIQIQQNIPGDINTPDAGSGALFLNDDNLVLTLKYNDGSIYPNLDTSFVPPGTTNTDYATYAADSTLLDITRSYQVIDITSQDTTTLSWYLPDGLFGGQTVTFILNNTGGASTAAPNNIWVFVNSYSNATGQLYTAVPWYPFESVADTATFKSTGVATWINGAWYTDNNRFD